MALCTRYYFLKEHAMQQGAEATYNAEVDVDRIDIITDFIPLPKSFKLFKEGVHGDVVQAMSVYK